MQMAWFGFIFRFCASAGAGMLRADRKTADADYRKVPK